VTKLNEIFLYHKIKLSIRNWFRSLSNRERNLVIIAGISSVVVLLWMIFETTVEIKNSYENKIRSDQFAVEEVVKLSERLHGLESRLTELTTLYLNSTLSYEELTRHLDKVIKEKIGSDAYTLNRSKETEDIGTSFQMQRFTIKIAQVNLAQITELLLAFETGPPRMFLQKADISRGRNADFLSLSLELASIQNKK